MKRVGIFVFYDHDGIVDDYVHYLLSDLVKNLDRLIIVCNGILSEQGRQTFNVYSDEIFTRENRGFDAAAWKYILTDKIGWDQLNTYDELVLLNDTFYGPFYPFAQMFAEMENKPVDFWGITIHGKTEDGWGLCEYGYLPEHIQSYFSVFRANLFHSKIFREYWEKLPEANTFPEAVCYHEARFTKIFSDAGFKYGVLCDTRGIEYGYGYSDCHYIYNPLMLIEIYKCPVLKRKTLITDKEFLLGTNHASAPMETLDYIEANTDYDTNLIYKYLVRTVDPLYLPQVMNLNYIPDALPHESCQKRVVIIAQIFHKNTSKMFLQYLSYAAGLADWIIYVHDSEVEALCREILGRERLKMIRVENCESKPFFPKEFAKEMASYDLIGLFDDEMFAEGEVRVFSSDLAVADNAWKNLLKSKTYIENIITLFSKNQYLGVLTHPHAYNGENLGNLLGRWKCDIRSVDAKLKPKVWKLFEQQPLLSDCNLWMTREAAAVIYSKSYQQEIRGLNLSKDSYRQLALNLLPYHLQKKGMYTALSITAELRSATLNNEALILKEYINPSSIEIYKLFLKSFLHPRIVAWLKSSRAFFRRHHHQKNPNRRREARAIRDAYIESEKNYNEVMAFLKRK